MNGTISLCDNVSEQTFINATGESWSFFFVCDRANSKRVTGEYNEKPFCDTYI